MDSASPIAERNAGQTSLDSGRRFTLFAMENNLAGKPAADGWHLSVDGYRGRHHPLATGYGHPG
jgi:hypothetical protein